jgi:hypothetical protein
MPGVFSRVKEVNYMYIKDIPGALPYESDTSEFDAPEGYPSWVVIRERLNEDQSANEINKENQQETT